MVFFVLSGYWIAKTVDRRKEAGAFWQSYLVDRLSRLLVVLVPALLIGGGLDAIGVYVFHEALYSGNAGPITMRVDVAERLGLVTFLGNVAFLQGLFVPTFGSNSPLWSLAYEFWYYIWYPALLLAVVKRRFSVALVALILAVLFPSMTLGFVVWALGGLLYRIDQTGLGKSLKRKTAVTALLGGVIILFTSITMSRLALFPGEVSDILVGVCFMLLLWSLLLVQPRLPRYLRPGMLYGARASFSLYVTHFPLVVLFSGYALDERLLNGDRAVALLLGAYGIALAFGWVFAWLTEARTDKVRKALSPKPVTTLKRERT